MFEDAPAGIAAAEAAGAAVLVVTAAHAHPLQSRHPSIASYAALACRERGDGWLVLEGRGAQSR